MAYDVTIGGEGSLFVGEDKTIRLELVDKPPVDSAGVAARDPLPVDMTGWDTRFDVRLKDTSPDPAIVNKTTLPIIGSFNAVRALNTQRAILVLTDDDMNLFRAKTYRHTWKRMDGSLETVLMYGNFSPQKGTVP